MGNNSSLYIPLLCENLMLVFPNLFKLFDSRNKSDVDESLIFEGRFNLDLRQPVKARYLILILVNTDIEFHLVFFFHASCILCIEQYASL